MAPIPALGFRSRRSSLRRRSWHSACSLTACPLTAGRPAPQPEQRRTRSASAAATSPRHGATFPRLSGATFGNATEDAAVIAIRSPDAAATRLICCRSTTCCRSPTAAARIRLICALRALLITECATDTGRLAAGGPDVAPPPLCWRAARLRSPMARRWAGPTHVAPPRAERASSLLPYQTLAGRYRCAREFLPLPAFAPDHGKFGRIIAYCTCPIGMNSKTAYLGIKRDTGLPVSAPRPEAERRGERNWPN